MMGRLSHDQEQFFYSFRLDEAVPEDHAVREIAAVLDLSWAHSELAPHYPKIGRPSIDPVLMIRMLIVGYVFGIRSERALCREVQVTWPIGKKSPASAAAGYIQPGRYDEPRTQRPQNGQTVCPDAINDPDCACGICSYSPLCFCFPTPWAPLFSRAE